MVLGRGKSLQEASRDGTSKSYLYQLGDIFHV